MIGASDVPDRDLAGEVVRVVAEQEDRAITLTGTVIDDERGGDAATGVGGDVAEEKGDVRTLWIQNPTGVCGGDTVEYDSARVQPPTFDEWDVSVYVGPDHEGGVGTRGPLGELAEFELVDDPREGRNGTA